MSAYLVAFVVSMANTVYWGARLDRYRKDPDQDRGYRAIFQSVHRLNPNRYSHAGRGTYWIYLGSLVLSASLAVALVVSAGS
jgi:hypothetical protein